MALDISQIKSLIDTHLPSIHRAHDVAAIAGSNAETLRKEFRRHEGHTLSEYIKRTRCDRIKDELAFTDKACHVILFDCGFKREDSGARFFRNATGMTMMAFRARAKAGGGPPPPRATTAGRETMRNWR